MLSPEFETGGALTTQDNSILSPLKPFSNGLYSDKYTKERLLRSAGGFDGNSNDHHFSKNQ